MALQRIRTHHHVSQKQLEERAKILKAADASLKKTGGRSQPEKRRQQKPALEQGAEAALQEPGLRAKPKVHR